MPLQLPTGAVDIAPIVVVPVVDTPTRVGFDFQFATTAGAGTLFDHLVSYRVTGVGASVNGATLAFGGSSTTGDAAVTVVENLCIGGTFAGADGLSGCSGNPQALIVIDTFGSADPPASLAFAPNALLAVVTDIGVDGGSDGRGTLTSASNRFTTTAAATAVPEPETALLWLAGLAACVARRRAAPRVRSRVD